MSIHQKLAYLQRKLAVARTLGDTGTEGMWQHLIDELRQRISALPKHQTSSSRSTQKQNQPEDHHDTNEGPKTTAASG